MAPSIEHPNYRRRTATLLALLASERSQVALARKAGRERIAYELARAWFDDVYLPSGRYLRGLKGDFSRDAAERFRDAFDPVELAALDRFHRFFELRLDMLPDGAIEEGRIPIDGRWRSLMRDAGYLLEDLGVDGEDLRRRLRIPADVSGLIRIEA